MTNEEIIAQIRAEIEKLIERYSSVKAKGILQEGYKGGRLIGYEDTLNVLKHIQENLEKSTLESEKLVHNNLEEAARQYFENPENSWEVRNVFIAAAKWDREQMLKNAVEADVNTYRDLVAGKSWAEFVVEMPTNNLGDKVKIIIVKEN